MPVYREHDTAGGNRCDGMCYVQEKNAIQEVWNKTESRKPQREKTERNARSNVR